MTRESYKMDEVKDCVKHFNKMCESFPDYPCSLCDNPECYEYCTMWEKWFRRKWQQIRNNTSEARENRRRMLKHNRDK